MTYGCHNKPRPVAGAVTHEAQDGQYYDEWGQWVSPYWYGIRHVMTTECQYDKSATDKQCAGCQHAKVADDGR